MGTTKILYLTHWYPNRYDSMSGLFVRRHAELTAGFADVALVYLHKVGIEDKTFKGTHIEIDRSDGITGITVYYHSYNRFLTIDKIINLLNFLKAWMLSFKILRKEWGTPSLVHVNILTRTGVLALWLKWQLGIPYVITEHWTRYFPGVDGFKGSLRRLITRIVVSQASALSSVSQSLVTALDNFRIRNKNTIILPNIVDVSVFDPAGARKKIKQILHVSCFIDKSKNISGILQVIRRLSLLRNDFTLLLVGDGIDFDQLKSRSDSYGLTDRVVYFTGLMEGEQLADAYKQSSFFLLFSHKENMPVVISEAFACGLPVVSSDVGGIFEYVSEWNGRLVPPGDEEALFNTINYMLDHYDEFNAKMIREFAITNFSSEIVSQKLKELYRFTGKLKD